MTVGDFKRYFVQHFLSYDMAERTSILSIIMEETLGMNQVEAILYHDQEIAQEKKRELQRVCQELSKNIPIQYIYQKAHFLGLSLYVAECQAPWSGHHLPSAGYTWGGGFGEFL